MDKDLIFKSLSALVEEFRRAYCVCGHELVSVYVGLPFSSSPSCTLPVVWRTLHIDLKSEEIEKEDTAFPAAWKSVLDQYGQSTKALLAFHQRHPRDTPSSACLYAWLQEKEALFRLKNLLARQEKQEEREAGGGGGVKKAKGRSSKKKRAWLVPSPSGA
jgi:hypothetical protein